MNGQDLIDLMTQILGGEEIDPTYALALLNVSRVNFELTNGRPWTFLKAGSSTLVASAGKNYGTAYAMPSPASPSLATPYLMRYLNHGSITLTGVGNTNSKIVLEETAFENQISAQGQNYFYTDYANRQFYILANLPNTFTISQFFIADYGDITLNTTWVGFPQRFAPMLAFDAVARYRLGTDYDDLAARNGDDNYKTASAMFKSLIMLDSQIASQQATNRSFGGVEGSIGLNSYPSPNNGYNIGYG